MALTSSNLEESLTRGSLETGMQDNALTLMETRMVISLYLLSSLTSFTSKSSFTWDLKMVQCKTIMIST